MKEKPVSPVNSSFQRSARRAALLAAALLLSFGAGPGGAATLVPEAQVRVRANERWQLLVTGKFDQAYEFLAPGYRAIEPLESYRRELGTGASWTDAQAVRVSCNDAQDNCTAVVRVTTRPFLPGNLGNEISTYLQEVWIRQDGRWWLFPKT